MDKPNHQPVYEIDTGEDAPKSEAEAVAKMLREDEALAKRLSGTKPKAASVGTAWRDKIGGGSTAMAMAAQKLAQEQRQADLRRASRRSAMKLMAGFLFVVVIAGAGVAVIGDYIGTFSLGIFERPAAQIQPTVVAIPAQRTVVVATPMVKPVEKPIITAPPVVAAQVVVPEPEPVVAAAPEPKVETAEMRRARDRVAAKQRTLAVVTQDLAKKDAVIRQHLFTLYGFTVEPRDVVPDRNSWRRPSAALEQDDAYAAVKPTNNTQAVHGWMNRRSNADTAVRNLLNAIAEERGNEASIKRQVERVKKDLQQAQTALESISH